MKNKILFLILIGLLTPTSHFSLQEQPKQTWGDWFRSYLPSRPSWMRMPTREDLPTMQWAQNLISKLTEHQRKLLLAALIAAGAGATVYYTKPELTPYALKTGAAVAIGGLGAYYLTGNYEEIKTEIISEIVDKLTITATTKHEDFNPIVEYLQEKEKRYQNNSEMNAFLTDLIRTISQFDSSAQVIKFLKEKRRSFEKNQALNNKLYKKIKDIQSMLGNLGKGVLRFEKE